MKKIFLFSLWVSFFTFATDEGCVPTLLEPGGLVLKRKMPASSPAIIPSPSIVDPILTVASTPSSSKNAPILVSNFLDSKVIKNDYKGSVPEHTPVTLDTRASVLLGDQIVHAPDKLGSDELLITPLPHTSRKPYWLKFSGQPLNYDPLRTSEVKVYEVNENLALIGNRNLATLYDLPNTKYTIFQFKDFNVTPENRVHADDWVYIKESNTIVRMYVAPNAFHIQFYSIQGIGSHPHLEFIKEDRSSHSISIRHWAMAKIASVDNGKIKFMVIRAEDESDSDKGIRIWPAEYANGAVSVKQPFPLPTGVHNWILDERSHFNPVCITHNGEVYRLDLATGKPELIKRFPELDRTNVTIISWRSGALANGGDLLLLGEFAGQKGLYAIDLKNKTIQAHPSFNGVNAAHVNILTSNLISFWKTTELTAEQHTEISQKLGIPTEVKGDKVQGSSFVILELRR